MEKARAYVTEEQRDRWTERAEEAGMSRSRWIAAMVEAGCKAADGVEPEVGPDETAAELREQRDELRRELEEARGRVSELESRAYGRERREAEEFVKENPGATHAELVSHLQRTVTARMGHLTDGLVVDVRDDGRDGYWHRDQQGEPAATDGEADLISELGVAVHDDGGRP